MSKPRLSKAHVAAIKAGRAAEVARKYSIPVARLPDWRRFKAKGFGSTEAADLIRERPAS